MNNQSIPIDLLFPKLNWDDVKIHVAQKALDQTRPIDVFTRSFDEWQNVWNGDFHSNHCWNRKYIFSIIELPNKPNRWLFGGIFEVISHKPGKYHTGKKGIIYKVKLDHKGKNFIGRLIIHWVKKARAKGRKPETMLPHMSIAEVLPESYIGEDFPGYAYINHSYATLEKLWQESKPDWKIALMHCKGVYLITDIYTGLRYVGSAYGEEGIWSRWDSYFRTGGHGNNKLLKKVLLGKNKGVDYAQKNFTITLLEQASSRDSEHYIIERESYWKDVLLTRSKIFGLNDN